MTVQELAPSSDFRVEAERFRASGALGRSDVMNRLFDFLLERSAAGDIPKEVEVALEVFGKDAEFDAGQDASVRVYIYRLRKKLDEYYALRPGTDSRLFIPRGEYRLAIAPAHTVPPAPAEEEEIDLPPAVAPPKRGFGSSRLWAIAAALLLLVSAVGWLIVLDRRSSDPSRAALGLQPWAALNSDRWATFLVLGDYYIFGEMGENDQLSRLVREFSVNSSEDLDHFLMFNPELMDRYVNLDLHYLPVGAAPALHALEPLVRAAVPAAAGPLRVVTASSLNPAMIRGGNIVYVGYLSGLGMLGGPALGASQFEVGSSYDELIDRRTGRHYESDWSRVMDARTPTRDYAYFASIPGPSGTRLIIVAGTRDAGLAQAAEIAANAVELRRIAETTRGSAAFEALYEVQTLGSTNLGSKLVAAYPLQADKFWQDVSRAEDALPDKMSGRR